MSSKFWVSRKLAVAAILFFRNCWKSIPAKLMPPYIHIKHMGWYIHNYSFNWSDVVNILSQQKIGCGGHLAFQKLLKINTSQAYAPLYPYTTFGEDIFIIFPLIDRTSSIFWVIKKLAVAAILFFRNCWKSIPAKLMPPYIHIKHMVVIYS